MEQELGILIGHGSAPYQHDEKNGASYFAVIEDEQGNQKTLWGVDIERSLEAARAEIGDTVNLARGEKKQVTIQEKKPDGTTVDKIVERVTWETHIQYDETEMQVEQLEQQVDDEVAKPTMDTVDNEPDKRFAVSAPYWLNGLHNREGLALAEEINKVIASKKLEEEPDAIEQILSTYSSAKRFGLEVISEKKHLADPLRKLNLAEPRLLLDGAFVRDKDGEYRPAAGGRAILTDKHDSLVIKNKDPKSFEAAVELAKAKGWTAISLKGKPAVMESIWISAKLAGIEVTNYTPSKEAQTKFAERLAQLQAEERSEMHQESAVPCVSEGSYSGKILAIEGNQVIQKVGRDPDKIVRHDISKLSRVPEVGAVEDIAYDKAGRGIVKDKALEKAGIGR